jgi:hypothetical protein
VLWDFFTSILLLAVVIAFFYELATAITESLLQVTYYCYCGCTLLFICAVSVIGLSAVDAAH